MPAEWGEVKSMKQKNRISHPKSLKVRETKVLGKDTAQRYDPRTLVKIMEEQELYCTIFMPLGSRDIGHITEPMAPTTHE